MTMIPTDYAKHGKSVYSLHREVDALHLDAVSALLSETWGKQDALTDGLLVFKNTVSDGSTYKGGFATAASPMKNTASRLVYAAELSLCGMVYGSVLWEAKFTDGVNVLRWYSTATGQSADTLFDGTVNGAAVAGSAAYRYNICGNYNGGRGTTDGVFRENVTFRVDFELGEISLWVNDQCFDAVAVAGLDAFGTAHWEVSFSASSSGSKTVSIGQIGLTEER